MKRIENEVNEPPVFDNKIVLLTATQAKAIMNGDQSAYDKFFTDNYDLFRRMSVKYIAKYCDVAKLSYYYTVDDIISQLYIDLRMLCDFNRGCKWILLFIKKRCLPNIRHGGLYYLETENREKYGAIKNAIEPTVISLDKPLNDTAKSKTFGDMIPFRQNTGVSEKIRAEVIISELCPYLTEQQSIIMAALVSGTDNKYIPEFLPKARTRSAIRMGLLYALEKLFNNYDEVKERLAAKHICLDDKQLHDLAALPFMIGLQGIKKRRAVLTEEERAKKNAYAKAWREQHKEQFSASVRKYREKNKTAIAERAAAKRLENIEERRAKDRERYYRNKERVMAKRLENIEEYRAKARECYYRRKERKAVSQGDLPPAA